MSIHAALNHQTHYVYDRRVEMGPQTIRLRPAPHSRTPVLSYSLKIEPEGYFINWQQDPFGNYLARIVYPDPVTAFHVEVDLVADMAVYDPFDFFLEPEADTYPFKYEDTLHDDLEPYMDLDKPGPLFKEWLSNLDIPDPSDEKKTIDFIVGLNQKLQSNIDYVVRMEPGVQTPDETLGTGKGSCRDTGWMLVQAFRHLGIASRFVSGYLIQLKPDVKSIDGPSGTDVDFTDLHAWAEVYLPGAGWIGLDPTSGLLTGEGHIPLACTPRPSSAAPISGAVGEANTKFDFEMSVTRIQQSARVTLPYTEEQWQSINALGHQIDADLKKNDVRLTIGGEPTFVSLEDPDAAEWNTAAVGPRKRELGAKLIKRLRKKFAPNGLLHYGQGKWYPGEQLPRWAFALYWRADGKPIWSNEALVADETVDHEPTVEDAQAFLTGISKRLDVEPEAILPAYEDPWHFMGQERKLPENLDPKTNKLDDPLARDRLAEVFERGLETPRGFVLPIQRWNAKGGKRAWYSEKWSTRTKSIFLIPGDSPVGYRLPLPSLPHIEPSEYPYVIPADPFAERDELADPDERSQRFLRNKTGEAERPGEQQVLTSQVGKAGGNRFVRAAMTIEPRDGRLTIFMPPVESLDDYLDLVAAVEDCSAEMDVPFHLAGYTPPKDPRLNEIKVTPDPGVLEVNIQPASSWDEMVAITTTIYDEARQLKLGTEKFMLDGRHTGTGGGNHFVLGGAEPAASPFLRRPDLLQSLVTYWQHHPALSYLFSGLFIGPTSQAPRIDEARNDSLYEMELAFTQVPRPGTDKPIAPWLVDRIFRNLLIDVSGNTHRSEICIDKLYSPDGPTGRLGLVEFRAFEMPPHERMSLAQQLLLLGLVSRFWSKPYEGKLVRWGTQLADKFMLPYYVWQDFKDVIEDMELAGYPFDLAWFEAHFEFRFPRYGSIQHEGIELEVRQALEPWHVMGEEGAVGGTVRYVDSSVERLQVKLNGATDSRYVVGCNGKRVPLAPTGKNGESVGGIRFRAWHPSSSLHPTIGVDAPLTIDLYDTWTGRAVAGCTYHVAHPGGRNFEHFPVNSYEAESRRLSRFEQHGHSPGPSAPPEDISRPEFPCTLDLRWSKAV
ncbi:MAG: transglutaminase family protein [Rhodospirillaceae bacterium]